MSKLSIGIIGIGTIGSYHAQYLLKGEVPGAELTAVCDINPEKLKWAKEKLGENVQVFDNVDSMLAAKVVDGVMIATPHYDHPPLAIKALENGCHALIEKPAGVYTRQVREMNEVAQKSDRVFGIMYQERTDPIYQKARELIQSGELGDIKRSNWIMTSCYRSQSYYDSGGWRATWEGEGGGVLLNQCPHQLDLWQWICGMPNRLRSFCAFGKYHEIEVEDDVTAYVEYEKGASGLFVTSTGETPGSNRFEISGERGKIVIEDGKLTFWQLGVPERQFNREYKGGFGEPECRECKVPIRGKKTGHSGITTNWVDAIQKGTPLLAPGIEGINGLQLSNAMHLSSWTDNWADIPVDEELFSQKLQEKIKNANLQKEVSETKTLEVEDSF